MKDFERQVSAWTPNHTQRVQFLSNWKLRAESGGKSIGEIELPDDPVNTEIKWSSDSRAFFVEVSENAIGGQVNAYVVTGDALQKLEGPEVVATEFAKHHDCKKRGNIMQAMRWEQGSRQLLLMPGVKWVTARVFSWMRKAAKILKTYPQTAIEAECKKWQPGVPGR